VTCPASAVTSVASTEERATSYITENLILLPGRCWVRVRSLDVVVEVLGRARDRDAAQGRAVVFTALIPSGWGAAQYPWLLVDEVRIADGAGADATLGALLVVVGLAGVLVLPPLVYLFRLTQSEEWVDH
jgi:cytochrome bd-type quinol oxidase subunit 2